jgi:hypothetical protein
MPGDVSGGVGREAASMLNSEGDCSGGQRRIVIQGGRAVPAAYMPDADLPPGADVAGECQEDAVAVACGGETVDGLLRVQAKPRVVEVRDLKAERAGRVFPCMQRGNQYTGCVGYDHCKVLCWSPRPREREALVRVEKPTGGPCRDCVYAREVRGEVAELNGRTVRLMECRLGYWHGRTTVHDFVVGKIALNVTLPCPGYEETDMPHPAVERVRAAARRRMRDWDREKEEQAGLM